MSNNLRESVVREIRPLRSARAEGFAVQSSSATLYFSNHHNVVFQVRINEMWFSGLSSKAILQKMWVSRPMGPRTIILVTKGRKTRKEIELKSMARAVGLKSARKSGFHTPV
jgi:hypothetical protein